MTADTLGWDGGPSGTGARGCSQAVPMQRKPLVAAILVSAVVGVVLAVLAPFTNASHATPLNRGWDAGISNNNDRGWDHDRAFDHSTY
jgi:hypothetical protein